jgi:hypothetical protein
MKGWRKAAACAAFAGWLPSCGHSLHFTVVAAGGPLVSEPRPYAAPTMPDLSMPPSSLSPIVASMPPEVESSIGSVGRYILNREPDPVRRVRALHDWVADRIAYDVRALDGKPSKPYDAEMSPLRVFERRLAVCTGYANLMVALGDVTGDPIVFVHGDQHAWNTVDIFGHRISIDATSDAGYIEAGVFHKKFRSEYFKLAGESTLIPFDQEPIVWRYDGRATSRDDVLPR